MINVINLVTNEAVSRRFLNIENRLQSEAIPGEICGGKSGTVRVHLSVFRFFPFRKSTFRALDFSRSFHAAVRDVTQEEADSIPGQSLWDLW